MAKNLEKAKTKVDDKDKKSKILTAAVVIFLCLVFVVGFIWGLNSVLAMEGAYPPEKDTHGIYTEPKTGGDVAKLLNEAVNNAVKDKPKTHVSDSFDFDDSTLEVSGSEKLKDTIVFVKDGFVDGLNGNFEDVETDFNKAVEIRIPQISEADVESFECKYFARNYVYQCDICGAESDELLNGCPECGTSNLYVQQTRNEYQVSAVLKNSDAVLNANFAPRSDEEIRAMLGENFDGVLDIGKIDVNYDKLLVTFGIDRCTGELNYLEYRKEMTVKTDVTFKDKFADIGKSDISFALNETVRNEFTWPKIELSEEEMIIEPKKSDNLTATVTCSDPTKAVVKWTSSNEDVITIDDEGYMKAGKTPGESTITATFEFLGKTYTDTCVVSVKIPVESMKISKRSMTLGVGETKQLKATVSPSKSTVQTKTWYTEDEKIATVDENGVVTAVSSGTVTVYALSDDGYFKSSCEVTVK